MRLLILESVILSEAKDPSGVRTTGMPDGFSRESLIPLGTGKPSWGSFAPLRMTADVADARSVEAAWAS